MTEHSASPTPAPDGQAERGPRRGQIARLTRASVARIRAFAERRLEALGRFARAQIVRLAKALRLAEAAVELGELKAVAIYLRIAAALDRYHELAAGIPPPTRSTKAPSAAPSAATETLIVAARYGNDDPATEEEPGAAEDSTKTDDLHRALQNDSFPGRNERGPGTVARLWSKI